MARIAGSGLLLAGATALVLASIAQAAGPFDGTYRGSQKTIRTNNSQACTKMDRDNVVIRIVDGRFSRSWGVHNDGKGDRLDVQVAPDGSFKAQTASLSDRTVQHGVRSYEISGRIANGVLEADIGSNLCAVRMTLKKS